MRIDQFIYIVEIAKFGSISLVAEKLHISQPTISQAVLAMEEELGKKIFHRSRLGTKPTQDGKRIIKLAREILNNIEEIRAEGINNSNQLTGVLAIASVPSICLSRLPQVLIDYKNKFPGVSVTISEGGTPKIEKDVLSGISDLGFVATEIQNNYDNHKDLTYNHLSTGQIMACIGYKSSLFDNDSISFKEIINYPIVTYNPEYEMYKTVIRGLKKVGDPKILFQSGNTAAGKQIIAEGIGIGFCSDLIIEHDPYFTSKKIIAIPISDADIRLHYGWIKLKNRSLPTTGKEFIKVLNSPTLI